MTRIISTFAVTTILLLGATGLALADSDGAVTGSWTYQVGADGTPCAVTLTGAGTSGDVSLSANCPGGFAAAAHWHLNGSSLELISTSGEMIGVLHKTGNGYSGHQIDSGRRISLTRA